MDLEHEQRLTAVEERSKSNTHRIDKAEAMIEEIHELSKTMTLLCEQIKNTNETVEVIREDVTNLKSIPGENWKMSTKTLLNAVIGAIGAAIGAGIIYLIGI